jgi:hypothetical protein
MGKAFVYNTGSAEDDKKDDELRLTFGVFIDGTLNNKRNTQLRRYSRNETENSTITKKKKDADIEREGEDYDKIKDGKAVNVPAGFKNMLEYKEYLEGVNRTYLDRQGTDNSYSNDDTNVARMWSCCKEKYAIYVEGMGTSDNKQDSQDGFAFGSGLTGIRARVRLACERIAERVQKAKSTGEDSKKKVTQITFDVFGFSRGATSARNFVHEVNTKRAYPVKPIEIPTGYDSYTVRGEPRMKKRPPRKAMGDSDGIEIDSKGLIGGELPKYGHLGYSLIKNKILTPDELIELKIVVRFIGVYDTVSSYYERGQLGNYNSFGELEDDNKAVKLATFSDEDFQNDEKELGLHELELRGDASKFQKMVHFTAQDEHRKNFVLTRINQIPDRAIEKNLPGVHCDIGGAYENEDKEIIDEIGTTAKDYAYTSKVFKWKKPLAFPYSLLPEPAEPEGLDALRQDLIDQYWYKEKELEIHLDWGYSRLTGTRTVKKEYSYVALHFMEEYCQDTTMKEFITLPVAPKYPLGNSFLEEVKEHLHEYVFKDAPEWKFKSDGQLEKEAYERKEKEEEERKENLRIALNKQIDEDIKSGKFLKDEMKIKTDNLDPSIYRPKIVDKKAQELELSTEDKPTMLEEVVVYGYSRQKALRTLRHEYLHWSSTRDWFGMEPPNDSRQRESFPKS